MLNEIKEAKIRNILIFVSDSLRYDFLPEKVAEAGASFKTVSSSLYTASSFASMVSGFYPPKHGVHSWQDVLSERIRGLVTLEGFNFSLWCETTWTDLPPDDSQIHTILGHPKGIALEEIDPPFVYMEDDKGGHCPYGFPFGEFMGGGCPDFFQECGKKGQEELINQYKIGIQKSVSNFKKRLLILAQRRLLDETLVIFTSDHGELLGEYGGLTGHGEVACPELAYVPTVFIHSSLKPKKFTDGIIRHVDLFPTILEILNKKKRLEMDGISLLSQDRLPSNGLNFKFGGYFKDNSWRKLFSNKLSSIWDYHGGFVLNKLGHRAKLKYLYKLAKKQPDYIFMFNNNKKESFFKRYKNYLRALKHLSSKLLVYGNPHFKRSYAKQTINNYLKNIEKFKKYEVSLDKKTEEILKSLGYVD